MTEGGYTVVEGVGLKRNRLDMGRDWDGAEMGPADTRRGMRGVGLKERQGRTYL